MSKNSERVKQWRVNTKDRIIESMGGGCCVCGYNRSQRALALHHINPDEKDIGLGAVRASPKRWELIVTELRKCVLVCHNCHCEIHDGLIQIPLDAPKFDESYVDYMQVLKMSRITTTQCPVCGGDMPIGQKTCSRQCAGKLHRRFDWDKIDLAELLKTKSYLAIADELGVSDGAVHKRAKKLGLK